MTVTFRQKPHALRPEEQMIEIYDGGELVGAIYPARDGVGIRIISKYLENSGRGVVMDAAEPPTININFIRYSGDQPMH